MVHQMAKLVGDDVFYAGFGGFDELGVEEDFAFGQELLGGFHSRFSLLTALA